MLPILYTSITEGTVPSNYGEGVLSDCLSCSVKEARNGEYELTMEYSAEGIHADAIVPNAFIMAKPNFTDSAQLFRIYKVGKTINGHFTVYAQHVSYDLSGKVITSGTAASCTAACLLLTGQAGNFTITTDKTVSADFKISEPSSVRSWFGGKQGSILDVYGPGEWAYDNFSAEFKAARGTDRGVTIRYGKNLTELSQTLDMTNLASAIVPYYKAQDGTITAGTAVSTGLVGITRELAVDFSASVDPESVTPIATQLTTLATNYISNNNFTQIKDSITLNFVQMKELSDRVDLCDTVHIYFEPLGITATAKCIETVWDVIGERYTSTSFGDPKTNIADTIVATQKAIDEKPSTTVMQQAIDQATELITGNLGGYVVLHDSNGDGEPDEILIMDTADIATATAVWRWNQMGLGFSPNGYAGPYNAVAIDMLGQISASAITTGTLNANLIKAGTISDVQGNSTIDMTNGEAKMLDFKAVNSLQLVDSSDLKRAGIEYTSGTGESYIRTYNSNGDEKVTVGTTSADEGQIELTGSNDDIQAVISGGQNGGYFELDDVNLRPTCKLFNETNGGGQLQLFDKGSYEAKFQIFEDDGYEAVRVYVNNRGGRMEVHHGGYLFGSFFVYNNSGVLELEDMYGVQIQCRADSGKITCVTLVQTSSRKVKENIKPMEDYRKILELEAVSFDFKNKERGTDKRGFIAEDVQKVLPNLVMPESGDIPASLDYIGMIPYLQAVIKDQEKRIEALEKKINGK